MTKGSTQPRRRTLLDRLFRHEEINGGGRCPTYLHRWTLLKLWRGAGVYLHQFVGDDWSRDLHDHPKRFVSIGLWGSYIELTPVELTGPRSWERDALHNVLYRAPWVRTFAPEHIHRIVLTESREPCWTLVLVGPTRRMWGFWHGGEWWPWESYLGTEHADTERSC